MRLRRRDGATGPLRVLHLRDYSLSNPYQHLLTDALRSLGVESAQSNGLGALPVLGAVRSYGRPDVLHLHWPSDLWLRTGLLRSAGRAAAFLLEVAVLRLRGVAVVYTAHNLADHAGRHVELERRVNRVLARMCDRVVVHAEASRQPVAKALGLGGTAGSKIVNVPHPSYLQAYAWDVERATARRRLGLDEGHTVLAHVGQLRPYKGLDQLIAAFRLLPGDDLRLVIAGRADDDYGARLQALAVDEARVRLRLGHVSDEELPSWFAAADLIVLPYSSVLSSGSALLAISAGRPVVAPRTGALAEVLAHQPSLLYDPGSATDLAAALRSALSTDLAAIGRRARTRAEQLDWPSAARLTAQHYHAVQRRSAPPGGGGLPGPAYASAWERRRAEVQRRLEDLVAAGGQCLLLDQDELVLALRGVRPFPAAAGTYTGPPADAGDSLVAMLVGARAAGATHLAVAWNADWWLDAYPVWRRHLRRAASRRVRTDAVTVWRL